MVRNVTLADAAYIVDIYNYYIEDTIITFEEVTVTEDIIAERISKISAKGYPFIVYEQEGQVIGYAYLNNWRQRSAYDITLETSVYVDNNFLGNGVGSILYQLLIEKAKNIGIHSLIGVISLPNDTSRELHETFGFKQIGNFRESGIKFGKYIDVEFWQLML